MKKLVALLLALLMVMAFFAGCTPTETDDGKGDDNKTPSTPNEGDKDKEEDPVTLKWVGAGWLANEKADTLIERYKDVAPNVTVEYTELSNLVDEQYLQMLDTMVAGGEQLDMTYLGTNDVLVRALNGAALPITSAITDNGDDYTADYGSLAASLLTFDGDIYGVPYANNTYKVFYNKTMTDAAGVTIPEKWTTDEFNAVAKKMNDPDNNVWGCIFPSTWDDLCYAPAEVAGWQMVKEEGGKIVANFDDDLFRQSMQWIADLGLTDQVSPTYAIIKAESLNRRVALASGQAAMIVDGPYTLVFLGNYMYNDPGAGALDFELGITEMPALNEDARDNASFLSLVGAFYVPKTGVNVNASYNFMRFICNGNFDKGTYMPAYTEADMKDAAATLYNYTDTKGTLHEEIFDPALCMQAVTAPNESHIGRYETNPELYAKYVPVLYKMYAEQYSSFMSGQITIDQLVDTLQTLSEAEIANVG